METLIKEINQCNICAQHLPYAPKPVIQVSRNSKIAIIGQAPGQKVQDSGIPWDDASGEELRNWLGVTKAQFYDENIFALVPMGFCYPGKGRSGDLPPRKECAPQWHRLLLDKMPLLELTLLIGKYAQDYYLGGKALKTLTENVKSYKAFLPEYLPLVHPSPRNRIWQRRNPWFKKELVPILQSVVGRYI